MNKYDKPAIIIMLEKIIKQGNCMGLICSRCPFKDNNTDNGCKLTYEQVVPESKRMLLHYKIKEILE